MNILLISQCSKKALTETRRILDQFAERRGERTWQTPITQAGLDTLHRLLRKSARRNTAVACHWIRGKDHSELLWIVGDASQFNADGATPTNRTTRKLTRHARENHWHTLEVISQLACLAALLHDLGKACAAFQARLRAGQVASRNLYRHEWVSLRLFQAFVGVGADDASWLGRLAEVDGHGPDDWLRGLLRDGLDPAAHQQPPLAGLPPLAQAVGWLMLSHHRLPVAPSDKPEDRLGKRLDNLHPALLHDVLDKIQPGWNERPSPASAAEIAPYWQFSHGLPVADLAWRKRAARCARRLLDAHHPAAGAWLDDPYVMQLSRLTLMLADHHYSSLTDPTQRRGLNPHYPLHANTGPGGALKQTLDEHLLGVAWHAGQIAHALPELAEQLPRLARHKGLQRHTSVARFQWQNRAADCAAAMRARSREHGAFIVNMASTGCGKTLGNARVMYALAEPTQGLRCAFALGLRTLTLQTGRVFRQQLQLGEHELAIQVGGAANRQLFEHYQEQAEQSGSASSQDLLAEDSHVLFEGNDQHPLLQRLAHSRGMPALLGAPVLVCTVDHLIPAGDSLRGGSQIAPMLRLMGSDLVLDEPDEFDIGDLPALTRLVFYAGLLGSRALLSSATLPPALVQGLFDAYLQGRRHFQRNRGERPQQPPAVCCAWFDEFQHSQHDCAEPDTFAHAHLAFAQRRHARLAAAEPRRRAELWPLHLPVGAQLHEALAAELLRALPDLHHAHASRDPISGKRVSFGLVRMANIRPLVAVALALFRLGAPAGLRLHLCVYHSQFPLLLRSAIEQQLDGALDRRQPDAVFARADIRHSLDSHPEADQLFVVLASPVCETGRDFCVDWALAEPSSMRALIQLAGRVRRHRPGAVASANLRVFDHPLRHFAHPNQAAYCHPGFEQTEPAAYRLHSHCLSELLEPGELDVVDARPRLLARKPLRTQTRLADLEHGRVQDLMCAPEASKPLTARELRSGKRHAGPLNAASIWSLPRAWLTGVLPQQQPFREQTRPEVELCFLLEEDGEDYALHQFRPELSPAHKPYVRVDGALLHRIDDAQLPGQGISLWGQTDYLAAVHQLAEGLDISPEECARRFGRVRVAQTTQGWAFHPGLGVYKVG